MKVEVVYATEDEQKIIALELADDAAASTRLTVMDAVVKSDLHKQYREIEIGMTPVGIYGERVQYDTVLHEGDRVEIYRPLIVDPMEARRLRARGQATRSKKKGRGK